ncbi:lysozyme P-like [Lucilia sericata]|uniref:lysozyme P-like n=1 Tax=Lucilia sericata TaxID=13632 RepID=UPI0018A8374A|nr:lysozyme P-like [Lucilia sericata]
MKNIYLAVILALAWAANSCLAKKYTRCSFIREMSSLGVPKDDLARWACIARHESSFDTTVIKAQNSPKDSQDYGVFQINDKYWCKPSSGHFSYNMCKVSCNDLLSDDINASMTCALKVLGQQGWSAWPSLSECEGDLPYIKRKCLS